MLQVEVAGADERRDVGGARAVSCLCQLDGAQHRHSLLLQLSHLRLAHLALTVGQPLPHVSGHHQLVLHALQAHTLHIQMFAPAHTHASGHAHTNTHTHRTRALGDMKCSKGPATVYGKQFVVDTYIILSH